MLSALDRGLERLATSDVAPNDVDGVAELRARQHLVTRERADREPITEQAWHDLGARAARRPDDQDPPVRVF